MAIPHYIYLVMKMLGEHRIISVQGDFKITADRDHEGMEMALADQERTSISGEQRQLRKDAATIPKYGIPKPTQETPSSSAIQPAEQTKISLGLDDPSKTAAISSSLPPK